jgi:hypothetical protein
MLGSAGSNVGASVGVSIMASAPFAGPGAPVVAAVGALVELGSAIAGALHIGEGCGPTCVQATSIVNQVEVVMKQNLVAFQGGQLDRQTAIDNFSRLWNTVLQGCSAIPGAAGTNCIGDRQRGGKWNWFALYLDPIQNAPQLVTTNTVSTPFMSDSVMGIPVWVLGAGLILAIIVS